MTAAGSENVRNHAAFIWSVADLLRGDYKQSEYGKVILPFTVLRRLDCVLEANKAKVLKRLEQLTGQAHQCREGAVSGCWPAVLQRLTAEHDPAARRTSAGSIPAPGKEVSLQHGH